MSDIEFDPDIKSVVGYLEQDVLFGLALLKEQIFRSYEKVNLYRALLLD